MSENVSPTTIYLIRHGETEDAEEKRYKGTIDVPLSEKGASQMQQVARHLYENYYGKGKNRLISALYTSDLSRAFRSAEIIAQTFALKPIVLPSLRERNFGRWEGMSFDEIRHAYPEEFQAWAGNPVKFSPLDGETTFGARDRVIPAVEEIVRNNRGNHVIIVTHGGVNRIILCHFLGIPLENIFRIEQDYAALNIIEFTGAYPLLKLCNWSPLKAGKSASGG
jgi:alpha-ribazole phosphatase/probable phosphoglycerate mutase